jgi:hypothetical protein
MTPSRTPALGHLLPFAAARWVTAPDWLRSVEDALVNVGGFLKRTFARLVGERPVYLGT